MQLQQKAAQTSGGIMRVAIRFTAFARTPAIGAMQKKGGPDIGRLNSFQNP